MQLPSTQISAQGVVVSSKSLNMHAPLQLCAKQIDTQSTVGLQPHLGQLHRLLGVLARGRCTDSKEFRWKEGEVQEHHPVF